MKSLGYSNGWSDRPKELKDCEEKNIFYKENRILRIGALLYQNVKNVIFNS
jgi:hypothetical protein